MRAPRFLPISWMRKVYDLAYPPYDCEQCVGQEPWQGCYCSYHGAVAPGENHVEWWRGLLRRFVR